MNWHQAQHFVVLSETLNFRRAAERLHIAQPPLSMSIKRLEEELGAPLFLRETTGLRLTAVGKAVLPHAREVVFHVAQMKVTAESAIEGIAGHLRIGFVGSATYRMIPRVLTALRGRYPQVQLELREGTTIAILRQVELGELDVGLVRYPVVKPTQARLVPVEYDQLVAALPFDNSLAKAKSLRLRDLRDQSFVIYAAGTAANLREQVVSACQLAGEFTPRIVQEAVQVQTLLSLVASGIGVALVPSVSQAHRMDGVVFRTLGGASDHLDVAIAAATNAQTGSAIVTRFCELLLSLSDNGRQGKPMILPAKI